MVDKLLDDADVSEAVLGFTVNRRRRRSSRRFWLRKASPTDDRTTWSILSRSWTGAGVPAPPGAEDLAGSTPFAVTSRYGWMEDQPGDPVDLVRVRSLVAGLRQWAEAIISRAEG